MAALCSAEARTASLVIFCIAGGAGAATWVLLDQGASRVEPFTAVAKDGARLHGEPEESVNSNPPL